MDRFGGKKRAVEQAAAKAEAQRRQTEAAHLSIAGRVVNQVLTIAAIRDRIDTADALLKEDLRNVDLTEKRRKAGEGTLVEVLNAQSQYEADRGEIRSEEHTSELQSLMRISYAVFCLKKKNTTQ